MFSHFSAATIWNFSPFQSFQATMNFQVTVEFLLQKKNNDIWNEKYNIIILFNNII